MIPVFQPDIGEEETQSVLACLRRGDISGSGGKSLGEFERRFAAIVGMRHGVAVSSGTTALHLAVAAAELDKGSEILVSASTNIATALAVVHNSCIPVPVDSEQRTGNLDLDLIEASITPKTRAIIPVHLFGHPVEMDRLMAIARRYELIVVEDCAEAHGALVRGRMAGSFGEMACFSFYANKIITTGEGGMVLTNSDTLADRLRLLRNLAFAPPRFKHERLGFNFRLTAFQAALALPQLDRFEAIIEAKRQLARRYGAALAHIKGLRLPIEEPWARNVYWMYAIELTEEFGISRDELMRQLSDAGIETRTFFCPMNQQPCLMGIDGFKTMPCPIADRMWQNGLYLPSSHRLTEGEVAMVAEAIAKTGART